MVATVAAGQHPSAKYKGSDGCMGLWSLLVTRFPGMSLKGRKKENLFFVVLKSCTLRIETLYTLVTLIIFSLKQRREKKHDFLLFF